MNGSVVAVASRQGASVATPMAAYPFHGNGGGVTPVDALSPTSSQELAAVTSAARPMANQLGSG
jgi:hypothetical protein